MKVSECDAVLYECGHMIAQRYIKENEWVNIPLAVVRGNCPKCESGETIPEPEKLDDWEQRFEPYAIMYRDRVVFG